VTSYAAWISDAIPAQVRPAMTFDPSLAGHELTSKLTQGKTAGAEATRLVQAAHDTRRGLRRIERAQLDQLGASPYTAGTS
jgi:hypothetical protein